MARRSTPVLLLASLLVLAGFGADVSRLRPGDRVGRMVLVRGTAATGDLKLFDICDPVITRSGRIVRRCGVVPRVKRLFIGYGEFAPPRKIDGLWATGSWASWLDGRRIQLAAFGTSDRTLYAFPPAGGRDVTLREWRVTLTNATPGRHSVRYRVRHRDGEIDATWIFTVAS